VVVVERNGGEVGEREEKRSGWIDDLERLAVDGDEASAESLVALADDLKAAPETVVIEIADEMKRRRAVINRVARV